jgi:hypothetical protein
MSRHRSAIYVAVLLAAMPLRAQVSALPSSSSQSRSSHSQNPTLAKEALDPGAVSNGIYRNIAFTLFCKIPAGWVIRTDELNARDDATAPAAPAKDAKTETSRVLMAAFSRPPQARAEDVNSSILIAAESASLYPGLKDAAQYFGPLTEVTKAQGFAALGEPYEFAVGTKTLARGDFQKDVGTRVMRQSTLVMLARGYVVSFTFIGGTEDEVEELVGGLTFATPPKAAK